MKHSPSPTSTLTDVVAATYSSGVVEKLVELCLRCGAEMEWRHGTWQCVKCRFKLGCCEGECPDD
jgi:hypothetical protein